MVIESISQNRTNTETEVIHKAVLFKKWYQAIPSFTLVKHTVLEAQSNIGSLVNFSTDRIEIKRPGKYAVKGKVIIKINAGTFVTGEIHINGKPYSKTKGIRSLDKYTTAVDIKIISLNEGDYIEYYIEHSDCSNTHRNMETQTILSVTELLLH